MKNKKHGFTLLELMVTVAIVGIVASIALWSSSNMLEENRAENFLLELKRNVSYARSQAASSDEIVIVCPVQFNALKRNDQQLSCRSNWDKNKIIIVFIDKINSKEDRDKNKVSYNSPGDSLLRVMEKIGPNDKLKYTGNESMLRFNTSGRITTKPGDFVYCPNSGSGSENVKALTITQSGTAFYLGDSENKCG
ncbi:MULTISPECIES: GspH/FimT family pseudopilin [Pseudoalteromonas]|jgi:prepilin-type N-terminal cleavage/methylation domain-containing protein|uniref:Type II secretion system protein H n=1 Tax=Pseudoalteromonas aliena SW19 TaxID=1314866 RepID=A0ABR9DZK3_9GAMM|nr:MULTISPECIES: GspH/FimT family pseudopilin [Pseudoalteromonas]MBE0359806.1 type IV fimbrial biogenesis protein FimT [Pseudoalteromonas aliena SW19]